MSAILKKELEAESNKANQTHDEQNKKRPNIDHLLKKIIIERKAEKKNTLLMIVIGVVTIGAISVFLS